LPGRQSELFDAIADTGKPIVLVLMNGRPLTLEREAQRASAVLECWYPGERGAQAAAETLLGVNNPSGRLPISFPRRIGQLPVHYNRMPGNERGYYVDGGSDPLFVFGEGLSYADFEYSELEIDAGSFAETGKAHVRATVKNAGAQAGLAPIQLYVNDEYSQTVKPVIELKQVAKIFLRPGESWRVDFVLDEESLGTLRADMKWQVEPGRFFVWACDNARNLWDNGAPRRKGSRLCAFGEFEIK
jgi:beta-glucosidase